MDHDASAPPSSPSDADPPVRPETVRVTGLAGVGLSAAAAALGLAASGLGGSPPGILDTARLFLVFAGALAAGSAISMRPDLWWSWGSGAVAAGLGVGGLPAHWDSFRLLFTVLAAVAAVGVAFRLLPPTWRYGVGSGLLVFHFTGIFTAATSPPPQPWLTEQSFMLVYNPYLQFLYMRNAYHFYSPEPGPSSLLVFLLKTDTGETEMVADKEFGTREVKKYKTSWVVVPRRPADARDPLGLTYYRRLALTEQLARGNFGFTVPTDPFEKAEAQVRRDRQKGVIPYHPAEPAAAQYKLPYPEVARYMLPSYAQHVILDHTPDKATAAKTTVKVYRLEHRTLSPEEFVPGGDFKRRQPPGSPPPSPYAPTTYRPFFMGEFDVYGNLLNPREELLNWMIPIIPRLPGPNDPHKDRPYYDFLSVHALEMSPDEVLAADPFPKGRVFNWGELRWSTDR